MARTTFKVTGIDEYLTMLKELYGGSENFIEEAVTAGADVVADAVRSEINAIPKDNRAWVDKGKQRKGLTSLQIKGLSDSFGVSPMRNDNGFFNRKIGFDGYNGLRSERWPRGQPNSYVARSIEKGTSWLQKYPFMEKCAKAKKQVCLDRMRWAFDSKIYDLTPQGGGHYRHWKISN